MKKVKLGEIAKEYGSGMTPLRSNESFWNSNDIPWLKTEQVGEYHIYYSNEFISKKAFEETSIKLFPAHTIVIAMYGEGKTRGNVSILMKPMTTNQACCNIVVDENKADYKFVYYAIKNNYFNLRSLSSGVRKNLNSDDVMNFQIPEYDISIQLSIANILSNIDDKIELNNKINAELESMAKTIYDYWFTQFDFPDENGRPYKSSGGKMVWNEELQREIPAGWEVKKLGDLLSKTIKGIEINTSEIKVQGSIPVIDQSTDFISGYTNNRNSIINEKCVIFGDHTRIVKFINFPFARGADGTQMLASFGMSAEQLYFLVKSIDLSSYGYARHFKFLKETKVIKPPVTICCNFESKIEKIFAEIKSQTFENLQLGKLRDWLLPMLMNGQVNI